MSVWFKRQRLEWIREMIDIFGFLNREHISIKFGISIPQASMDLRDAMTEWPGMMVYNRQSKRYERGDAE